MSLLKYFFTTQVSQGYFVWCKFSGKHWVPLIMHSIHQYIRPWHWKVGELGGQVSVRGCLFVLCWKNPRNFLLQKTIFHWLISSSVPGQLCVLPVLSSHSALQGKIIHSHFLEEEEPESPWGLASCSRSSAGSSGVGVPASLSLLKCALNSRPGLSRQPRQISLSPPADLYKTSLEYMNIKEGVSPEYWPHKANTKSQ